nr:PAS domain-containing protein [Hymenobacter profundi]
MALPALVATYHGPTHVYTFINEAYRRYFPTQALPGRSLREVLPETETQGVLAVMDRVYQTGEPIYQQELEVWLDFEGTGQPRQLFLNLFFHPLRDAQGRIDGLLDFTYDVTEQVLARRQVEQFNQQAQAARAEAEAERQRLHQVLMRMPANIALLRGPEHVYDLVNAEYERLFPARTTLGRTIREVIPDIEGQGFYELFDHVYETGEPFYQAEAEAWADFAGTGEPQRRYYRTTFEPIRDAQGQVTEVLNFAVDVTAQVEARQQVEQLNQELEARVQARTQEALALQADLLAAAQRQMQVRESFYQIFEQTPAAVSLLRGPSHRFEYVNPVYQQVFAGRQLVGRDFAEALPDAAAQGYLAMLEGVYHTGETFFGAERVDSHDVRQRQAVDDGA